MSKKIEVADSFISLHFPFTLTSLPYLSLFSILLHIFSFPSFCLPLFPKELQEVSPKACAEELGYTFLPCVLAYLHRAPHIRPVKEGDLCADLVTADDVDVVVAPRPNLL